MIGRTFIMVGMSAMLYSAGVFAQEQPATTEAKSPHVATEIRTYNVAGILTGGEAQPGAALVDMDALLKLIYQLVDTDGWNENGGTVGQIQALGNLLVIQQTEQNHKKIADLLEQIRTEQGPVQMLNIHAYWLKLTNAELRSLRDAAAKSGQILPIIPDDLLDESHLYCAAEKNSFTGLDVNIESTRDQTYIHDVTPIVGQDSVGYDPDPKQARSGVTLSMNSQLTTDGRIAIGVMSEVTELNGITQSSIPAEVGNATTGPAGGPVRPGLIDRVNVTKTVLGGRFNLPAGRRVLVSGITLDPTNKTEGARQLCLALEINVVK